MRMWPSLGPELTGEEGEAGESSENLAEGLAEL